MTVRNWRLTLSSSNTLSLRERWICFTLSAAQQRPKRCASLLRYHIIPRRIGSSIQLHGCAWRMSQVQAIWLSVRLEKDNFGVAITKEFIGPFLARAFCSSATKGGIQSLGSCFLALSCPGHPTSDRPFAVSPSRLTHRLPVRLLRLTLTGASSSRSQKRHGQLSGGLEWSYIRCWERCKRIVNVGKKDIETNKKRKIRLTSFGPWKAVP